MNRLENKTVVTCVKKVRDNNGKIVSYILVDTKTGETYPPVEAYELKRAIFRGAFEVDNLTLTKDGRLIDGARKENNIGNVVGVNNINRATDFTDKINSVLNSCGIDTVRQTINNRKGFILGIRNNKILGLNSKLIPMNVQLPDMDLFICANATEKMGTNTSHKYIHYTINMVSLNADNTIQCNDTLKALTLQVNDKIGKAEMMLYLSTCNNKSNNSKKPYNNKDFCDATGTLTAISILKALKTDEKSLGGQFNKSAFLMEKILLSNHVVKRTVFDEKEHEKYGADKDLFDEYNARREKDQKQYEKLAGNIHEINKSKQGLFGMFKR